MVRFLQQLGLADILGQRIDTERGSNAVYQLSDAILLTTISMVAGARSLIKDCAVWQDRVLRECARWKHVPSDSHLGRLLKLFSFEKVVELESAVHQMRGRAWKKALRSGRSKVYALRRITVDLDSTVKTVFGHQEGAEKAATKQRWAQNTTIPSWHSALRLNKEVLQGWQRTGNAYRANGAVEFMKQLLASLPAHMKILFRADNGYFGGPLLSSLEACGHRYLIKVSMRNLVKLLIKQNWKSIMRASPTGKAANSSISVATGRNLVVLLRCARGINPSKKNSRENCSGRCRSTITSAM